MNISSGLAGAVNGSQSLQQLVAIQMLKKAQTMDKQMAEMMMKSTQPDSQYTFSVYV